MADRCPRCNADSCPYPAAWAATAGLPGFGEERTPEHDAKWSALGEAARACKALTAEEWRDLYLAAETREAEARTIATSALDLAETLYTEIATAEDIGCRQIINAGEASDEIERLRAAIAAEVNEIAGSLRKKEADHA